MNKLSAFLPIFDLSMISLIVNCTNSKAQNFERDLNFTRDLILAIIGVFIAGVLLVHLFQSNQCGQS